jgi:hypothetical protein
LTRTRGAPSSNIVPRVDGFAGYTQVCSGDSDPKRLAGLPADQRAAELQAVVMMAQQNLGGPARGSGDG